MILIKKPLRNKIADKKVLRIFTGEEDDQWDLKRFS